MNFKNLTKGIILPLLIGGVLTSCVSKKKYNTALQDKDALMKQNIALKDDLRETKTGMDLLEDQMAVLKLSLEEQKAMRAMLSERNKTLSEDIAVVNGLMKRVYQDVKNVEMDLDKHLDQKDVNVMIDGGEIHLGIDDYLLFATNSDTLRPEGKEVLKKLAKVLEEHPNMLLTVEGHTDDRKFPTDSDRDNWELSVDRGTTVARQLEAYGVNSEQLRPAGRSSFDPEMDSMSDKARKENRRTEIILEPNLQPLFDEFYPEMTEAHASK